MFKLQMGLLLAGYVIGMIIRQYVFAHVTKKLRKKFDAKSISGRFFGYDADHKAYKICLPSNQEICICPYQDVIFNEDKFPGPKVTTADFIDEKNLPQEIPEAEHEVVLPTQRQQQDASLESREVDNSIDQSAVVEPTPPIEVIIPPIVPEDQFEQSVVQDVENLVLDEPIPRRSARLRKPSLKVVENAEAYSIDFCGLAYSGEPLTLSNALDGPEAELWKKAADEEMKSMADNQVWSLTELPAGASLVKCRWVLRKVYKQDGSLARYKACLVIWGFTQIHGVDYEETFSPVVRMESLRTLLAVAAVKNWEIHQMDVTTAFLHGELREDIFMSQPEGYVKHGAEKLV
ncbi:hypothetical protein R1sor_017513 [Riccia sorocarpa]|uniref:Reverse transcriptase Ty1/copia-type domain-containing protein n=1 Tax=Riccia sorocarpa TaxID=122646 RepID=A0ABD3IB33_9MARC